jgi:1,4-alpha-glucan branching enzyme
MAMPYVKLANGRVRFIWPDCSACSVFLVGDFNDWNERSHPLRKANAEKYELEVHLRPGNYRFKYLIDGIWWNDPDAEAYEPNPWGSEDSIIRISDK